MAQSTCKTAFLSLLLVLLVVSCKSASQHVSLQRENENSAFIVLQGNTFELSYEISFGNLAQKLSFHCSNGKDIDISLPNMMTESSKTSTGNYSGSHPYNGKEQKKTLKLVVNNAQQGDSGLYKCQVHASFQNESTRTTSDSVTLTVTEEPACLVIPMISEMKGDSKIFRCITAENDPILYFKLESPNKHVQQIQKFPSQPGKITLLNVTETLNDIVLNCTTTESSCSNDPIILENTKPQTAPTTTELELSTKTPPSSSLGSPDIHISVKVAVPINTVLVIALIVTWCVRRKRSRNGGPPSTKDRRDDISPMDGADHPTSRPMTHPDLPRQEDEGTRLYEEINECVPPALPSRTTLLTKKSGPGRHSKKRSHRKTRTRRTKATDSVPNGSHAYSQVPLEASPDRNDEASNSAENILGTERLDQGKPLEEKGNVHQTGRKKLEPGYHIVLPSSSDSDDQDDDSSVDSMIKVPGQDYSNKKDDVHPNKQTKSGPNYFTVNPSTSDRDDDSGVDEDKVTTPDSDDSAPGPFNESNIYVADTSAWQMQELYLIPHANNTEVTNQGELPDDNETSTDQHEIEASSEIQTANKQREIIHPGDTLNGTQTRMQSVAQGEQTYDTLEHQTTVIRNQIIQRPTIPHASIDPGEAHYDKTNIKKTDQSESSSRRVRNSSDNKISKTNGGMQGPTARNPKTSPTAQHPTVKIKDSRPTSNSSQDALKTKMTVTPAQQQDKTRDYSSLPETRPTVESSGLLHMPKEHTYDSFNRGNSMRRNQLEGYEQVSESKPMPAAKPYIIVNLDKPAMRNQNERKSRTPDLIPDHPYEVPQARHPNPTASDEQNSDSCAAANDEASNRHSWSGDDARRTHPDNTAQNSPRIPTSKSGNSRVEQPYDVPRPCQQVSSRPPAKQQVPAVDPSDTMRQETQLDGTNE
ncbi:uncharacterized protein LOC110985336 [Acanthaster planci]|uniref:Uncharacterized protein LOC110985336 n=1 Tax=Acanthaster planci TaxID=133434 RepID=A0A8B7ZAZ9_ACAPL|nr:uncharacterized protein LOC110985336 [Acanthaster planci]